MTMAEVEVLTDYWLEHPPAHLLLAGRRMKATPQADLARLLGADPDGDGVQRMRMG